MPSPTRTAVAATIRAEMARRSLTQRDVANHLGMSHAALYRRLNGTIALDTDELAKLAALFGMDARDLLAAPVETAGI
jgi:transcriptional regulator with XRE-family HTH domain